MNKEHQIIERINNFKEGIFDKIHIEADYLTLNDNELIGIYTSKEFDTKGFYQVIGSFSGLTSINSTIELKISCFVNGSWSSFASYNAWGFGRNDNHTSKMNDDIIKMVDDEIIVLNDQLATKVKYQIVFNRSSKDIESPKLKLVTLCLWFKDYQYNVDISDIPKEVKYPVPKLNQNIVPEIGNSICSPTSCTMLLKYLGHDFSSIDQYEHRYIADIVYDHGANIFGNWVFNCNTIAGFNHIAYTGIFYNLEELMKHLAEVGPVSLSIRGTMISEYKTYTTNGHLIVCTGYKNDNGNIRFYINDPNVDEIECTYSYDNIKNSWISRVAYIIEK